MQTIHLEHAGRTLRAGLHALPRARSHAKLSYQTSAGQVSSTRLINGIKRNATVEPDSLIAGDPELDLASAGIAIAPGTATTAYFDASADQPTPVGDFTDTDVVYDAHGTETARRPHLVRQSNLDTLYPIKLGKRLSLIQALTQFAIRGQLQISHSDGLSFEFLRDLAADLQNKGEVAVLGAGPKGNQPLVLREHGSAYRGFLAGEVDAEGNYQLLLLLSDQELKLPPEKPEASGDAA